MDTKIEARRIVTKPLRKRSEVDAFTSKDIGTGRKFYTPAVMGNPLRLAFDRKTLALEYAKRIYIRYARLLAAERRMNKENEL